MNKTHRKNWSVTLRKIQHIVGVCTAVTDLAFTVLQNIENTVRDVRVLNDEVRELRTINKAKRRVQENEKRYGQRTPDKD